MTNDQQQVEAWRKEFELLAAENYRLSKSESGHYQYEDTIFLWSGFIMAKRNQPVIELPEGDSDGMVDVGEVHDAITAAGYSYRVK